MKISLVWLKNLYDLKIPLGLDKPVKWDDLFYSICLAAVFFIPFDSFTLFPLSSTYRPVSMLIVPIGFLIIFRGGYLKNLELIPIILAILMIVHAIIMSAIFFGEYDHLVKVAITTILMGIGLIVFMRFHDNYHLLKEEHLQRLTNIFAYSLAFMLAIGMMQFATRVGLFPYVLSKKITLLFSYRSTGRLQMVSGEPSMMFRNLLLIWPFIYHFYKGPLRKAFLYLIVFFLLVSGSTYGYMILFILLGTHLMLFNYTTKNALFAVAGLLVLVSFLFYAYSTFLDDYTKRKLEKVVFVLTDPVNVARVLSSDSSIFQRTMNPIIGFLSGGYSYFLGLGLDNYRYIYVDYINEYFPYALKYKAVDKVVQGTQYITPKSFYARVYTELGVVPFLLFVGFMILLWRRVHNIKKRGAQQLYSFTSKLYSICVVTLITGGSLIYVNFLFLITLIYQLTKKNK
jgi:hypothetical protein